MNREKRKKLEAKGWKVISVAEFLELTPEEQSLIELRLALSNAVKKHRLEAKLSQQEAARLLNSSQSRIAKMEAGDASVSLDLLIRSLFGLGVTAADLPKLLEQNGIKRFDVKLS
ncbi:MAG: helix-turn-helix transcriptional regulator [Acidobacteria bacterium]|nr:helix-turn-helix transcriptional regulator [Acidobacteriota bacterium]